MNITEAGVKNMKHNGGSFVKALAEAWYHADHINKKKLEDTFSYFDDYEISAPKNIIIAMIKVLQERKKQ